ncbi:Hypothetical protein SRAE_2000420600 [Strongyloides ratti]|uniref:Uncharacterized protein n=1 Tax=Strongyloides ratti TaxID=34506 RepID=A0A090LN05_STRRB|nr:Hypothetical protein SRAE_2000420600 [Strongyloides ratti]CEF69558.2 Hypothetical protein SRAE_2000420600 [Strongyloides ratti]
MKYINEILLILFTILINYSINGAYIKCHNNHIRNYCTIKMAVTESCFQKFLQVLPGNIKRTIVQTLFARAPLSIRLMLVNNYVEKKVNQFTMRSFMDKYVWNKIYRKHIYVQIKNSGSICTKRNKFCFDCRE